MERGEPNMDIIGTGWAFPIDVDGRGGIELAHGYADIEQAIRIIIATAPGERRMRPNFGCRIHELVFAPNSATTFGLARHYVEEALGWWEPRIEVLRVDAYADPTEPARLMVEVKYRVRATKDERALVYPFYRIPGEE